MPVSGFPSFSTLRSPRTADGLPYKAAYSLFPRLHAVLTSGHDVDAFESDCLASIDQHPNLMKAEAALSHWSWPSAPHHAETRLCISLPFFLSFIANIARKKPELNRDKTKAGKREYVQVLRLLETFEMGHVHGAIRQALDLGAIGYDAVKHLILCRIERRPPRLDLDFYPYMPKAMVETTKPASYTVLLSEAVA